MWWQCGHSWTSSIRGESGPPRSAPLKRIALMQCGCYTSCGRILTSRTRMMEAFLPALQLEMATQRWCSSSTTSAPKLTGHELETASNSQRCTEWTREDGTPAHSAPRSCQRTRQRGEKSVPVRCKWWTMSASGCERWPLAMTMHGKKSDRRKTYIFIYIFACPSLSFLYL